MDEEDRSEFEAMLSKVDGLPPLWPEPPGWVREPVLRKQVFDHFSTNVGMPESTLEQCCIIYIRQRKLDVQYHEGFQKPCDVCKKICSSECFCGEAYCSRSCQRQAWGNHRRTCERIFEECMSIGYMLTQYEFQHLKKIDMNVCLGMPAKGHRDCDNINCPKPGTKTCTRCKEVWYCSKDCQVAHWHNHKTQCSKSTNTLAAENQRKLRTEIESDVDLTSKQKVAAKMVVDAGASQRGAITHTSCTSANSFREKFEHSEPCTIKSIQLWLKSTQLLATLPADAVRLAARAIIIDEKGVQMKMRPSTGTVEPELMAAAQ